MNVAAFPLQWPSGWKRTKYPSASRFKIGTDKAHRLVEAEVQRMDGTAIVISSNAPLRADGKMRMDRDPLDAGVAVYFTRNGKQVVFACDRFDTIRENLTAIGKTIDSLRGIERWGASDMMERAFSGFKALGTGTQRPWGEVLDLDEATATIPQIEAQFKRLARTRHPDMRGGSQAEFQELSDARQRAFNAKIT